MEFLVGRLTGPTLCAAGEVLPPSAGASYVSGIAAGSGILILPGRAIFGPVLLLSTPAHYCSLSTSGIPIRALAVCSISMRTSF